MFHSSDAMVRCFIGGNRSGKTTAGVVEDLWCVLGRHPFLDVRAPLYGRIAAQDLKILKKVVIRKIEEWVPQEEISRRLKGQYGFVQQYEFINGSILDLMSYEMQASKFESVDLDFCHFDEPPPEAIYNATRARLIDRNGRVWLTLTPLEEPWVYDKIYTKAQSNKRFFAVDVEMRENPFLSSAGIEAFEEDMDDEEIMARAKGQFRHLSGRVIKNFANSNPFVVESKVIPPLFPRAMGIDPHEQKPFACLWVCRNEYGQVEVYDELFDPSVIDTKMLAERIKEIEGRYRPELRVMDTSANKRDRTSGKTIRQDLNERGIRTTSASKADRMSRIVDLKGRFKIQAETGMPQIVIQEHCVRLIWELQRWVWEKVPSRAVHKKDVAGKPIKKDDDEIDCLMYICSKWAADKVIVSPIRAGRPIRAHSDAFVRGACDEGEELDPYNLPFEHPLGRSRPSGLSRNTGNFGGSRKYKGRLERQHARKAGIY